MAKQKMKTKLLENAKHEFSEAAHQRFKISESYISLLLGVVVVVVGVLLTVSVIKGVSGFQKNASNQVTTVNPAKVSEEKAEMVTKTYTVLDGESLSDIAAKVYGDGVYWTDIAAANNITDPNSLYTGQVLQLPKLTPTQAVSSTSTTAEEQKAINGNSYTVQEGDLLWDIAVRAYGDGFKWTDIAAANNLPSADAISSGQVLQIPR